MGNTPEDFMRRFEDRGDHQDLLKAIDGWHSKIASLRHGHDTKALALAYANLAQCYQYFIMILPSLEVYQAMIGAATSAVDLTLRSDPIWFERTYNLAAFLGNGGEAFGLPDDQDRSITLYRQLRDTLPPGLAFGALVLNNLSVALGKQYKRSGEQALLSEALRCSEQALRLVSTHDPAYPLILGSYADVLREQYLREYNAADITRAIDMMHEALGILTKYDAIYPGMCLNLATAYLNYYANSGDRDLLDQALKWFKVARETMQSHDPRWLMLLSNNGMAFCERYQLLSDGQDLAAALELCREAVDSSQPQDLFGPTYRSNLAAVLSIKALRMGTFDDLRQAIATIQAVLKILEPNATLRPILLNNLGCCLDDLAKHGKAAKRINAAIDAFREALSLTRADSPDWIVRSLNLAVSLNSLYRLTGDSIPLRESIAIGRALRAETSPATRQGVMVRGNLGSQLAEYANYMQEVSLIEEARAVTYEAIKAIDPDDSSYSVVTGTWGRILHVHSTLADHPSLVAEATAAYRQACQSGIDIAPEHVIRKGNSWGELAMEHGNWPEAAEAYGLAAKAQGLLYTTQLLPEDRYHWLGLAPKLHTNLAYAHARLGDFKQAVSAVESGHAREFGLAMERDRADLTTLESTRPELVARFESCRGALRAWQLSLEHPDMRAGGLDRSDGIHAIMAELRAITADIRAVPGYRRFLEWSDWDDVEAAVTPGSSLVYVLDTARGGLALVVSRQSAQSELSIAPHWLEKLTSAWLEGLLAGVPKRDGGESGQAYWTTVLERFGAALWDVGLGPLLATLASAQAEPLAVVPLGSLLALPLHLAWTELDDRRRYLLDTACLRIVPSARILHLTRAIAQSTDTRRLLVVQDPQPTTQKPLQSARAEAQSISVWYPQVTLLANAEATHAAVMTALAHADIAHFSCHGLADWDDTEKVGLVLAHDTFFYMHDLYSLRLQGARLAVLSACETGIVHPDLPNEVVMFALSFIYAGFAGAVASLWTVPGLSTAMLMERFYRFWHEDHLTPAEALRQAQLWMRDTAWTEKQTYYAGQIGRLEAEGDRYQAAIQALRSFSNALSLRRNELASESPYFWGGFQLIGV